MHDALLPERKPIPASIPAPDPDTMETINLAIEDALIVLPRWEAEQSRRQFVLADSLLVLSEEIRRIAQANALSELRTMHVRGEG